MINIKFKNEKSLFVGDNIIKVDRYVKKLERNINKGRCAKFDKTDDGYTYRLLESDYSYRDYNVEVGEHTNSKYAREVERLYKLANTKAMKNKYIKVEKDMYTKPAKIFKRNLSESFGDGTGNFLFSFGIAIALSMVLIYPSAILAPSALAAMLISCSPLIAQLSLFLGVKPLIETIKELAQNKSSKKKDGDKEDTVIDKSNVSLKKVNLMEPNKIKGLDATKEIPVVKNNSQEMLAKTRKQKAIVLFLKNKYRELDERRMELINNGGSKEEIIQIVNEMDALAYKVNTIIPSSTEEEVIVEEKPMRLELK